MSKNTPILVSGVPGNVGSVGGSVVKLLRERNLPVKAFPGIIGGMSDADRRRRALKLLDFFGIKNKANFKPLNLSGGQQQRVAIARSLHSKILQMNLLETWIQKQG